MWPMVVRCYETVTNYHLDMDFMHSLGGFISTYLSTYVPGNFGSGRSETTQMTSDSESNKCINRNYQGSP